MPDQKDAIAVLLAQFNALRGEIAGRSAAQTTLTQLAATAFGALAGLAFTANGDHRLLLLIPIISAILGLLWLDHAANISNIGDFIKDEIMPALKTAADMTALPDYEAFVREYEQTPGVFLRVFGLPSFLIFLLVPVVAMILASQSEGRGELYWTLFLVDALLLLAFAARWLPFLESPRRRAR